MGILPFSIVLLTGIYWIFAPIGLHIPFMGDIFSLFSILIGYGIIGLIFGLVYEGIKKYTNKKTAMFKY